MHVFKTRLNLRTLQLDYLLQQAQVLSEVTDVADDIEARYKYIADVSSASPSSDLLRRRASARNVSFRISLRWLIHIINSVDKTKLSCNTPTDAAPQFL